MTQSFDEFMDEMKKEDVRHQKAMRRIRLFGLIGSGIILLIGLIGALV